MFVDMLVIASPPIPDDVPAQQQQFGQTRYPEARRFNRCLLCLRETKRGYLLGSLALVRSPSTRHELHKSLY
jgi:hypothetical protein